MKYSVVFTKKAVKQLGTIDKPTSKLIYDWIKHNLEGCSAPRTHGKALSGEYKGLWRYRVGDYRLIAEIRDSELIIMMINVGHRREVYR